MVDGGSTMPKDLIRARLNLQQGDLAEPDVLARKLRDLAQFGALREC